MLSNKTAVNSKEIGTFKRMHGGKAQCFIEMGVPKGRSPNIKTFYMTNDEFEHDQKYYKHNKKRNTVDVYRFERQNVFQIRFEIYHLYKDGLYFHSDDNAFHRFIKVEVDLNQFLIRKDNHSQELDKIIRNHTFHHDDIRIKPLFNASSSQTISIRKLTKFQIYNNSSC